MADGSRERDDIGSFGNPLDLIARLGPGLQPHHFDITSLSPIRLDVSRMKPELLGLAFDFVGNAIKPGYRQPGALSPAAIDEKLVKNPCAVFAPRARLLATSRIAASGAVPASNGYFAGDEGGFPLKTAYHQIRIFRRQD